MTQAGKQDLTTLLQQAVAHHQAGRLAQAQEMYRAVLAEAPHQFDALHLLGVVYRQQGEAALALDVPLGTVMSRLGRARAALAQALQDDPALLSARLG